MNQNQALFFIKPLTEIEIGTQKLVNLDENFVIQVAVSGVNKEDFKKDVEAFALKLVRHYAHTTVVIDADEMSDKVKKRSETKMNFSESLAQEANNVLEELSQKLADTLALKATVAAKNGQFSTKILLQEKSEKDKQQIKLFQNGNLEKLIESKLDGVKVKYQKEKIKNLLSEVTNHYLILSWD